MNSLTELLQLHTKSAFPSKNQQEMPKSHLTNNVAPYEQVKFTSEYKILTVNDNDLTITVCIDNYFLCKKTEAFPFKYSLSKPLVYQQVGCSCTTSGMHATVWEPLAYDPQTLLCAVLFNKTTAYQYTEGNTQNEDCPSGIMNPH